MRSGDVSCVGDTVKFTCTIPAAAHAWRIASLATVTLSIALRNRTVDERYFVEVISSTNNPVMVTESRLTVTSFQGLNGQNIECFDISGVVAERQEATAMVFGKVMCVRVREYIPDLSDGEKLAWLLFKSNSRGCKRTN